MFDLRTALYVTIEQMLSLRSHSGEKSIPHLNLPLIVGEKTERLPTHFKKRRQVKQFYIQCK